MNFKVHAMLHSSAVLYVDVGKNRAILDSLSLSFVSQLIQKIDAHIICNMYDEGL